MCYIYLCSIKGDCDSFMRQPDLRFGLALRCLMIDLGKFAIIFSRLCSSSSSHRINRKIKWKWSMTMVTGTSGDVASLWHLLCWLHCSIYTLSNGIAAFIFQTSQELRMLSSVTINCQVTKIVMNSGSQLSEL